MKGVLGYGMKNIFTKISVCAILLLSLTMVTSCGENNKEEQPIINPIEITISIDYPDKAEIEDIKEETFKIEEDSTVLDAIQLYCNVNNIPLNVETTDGLVDGISDVNNYILYKNSSWKYKINDELIESPANTQILVDGDSLQWVYKK